MNIKRKPLFEQIQEIMSRAAVSVLHNPFDLDSTAASNDVVLVEDMMQDDVNMLEDKTSSDNPAEVFSVSYKN